MIMNGLRTGSESDAVLLPVDGGRRVGSDDASHLVRLAENGRLFRWSVLPRDADYENETKACANEYRISSTRLDSTRSEWKVNEKRRNSISKVEKYRWWWDWRELPTSGYSCRRPCTYTCRCPPLGVLWWRESARRHWPDPPTRSWWKWKPKIKRENPNQIPSVASRHVSSLSPLSFLFIWWKSKERRGSRERERDQDQLTAESKEARVT